MRWHRYDASIVGRYSENVTRLPFVRFRSFRKATEWVVMMNDRINDHGENPLTYFAVKRIGP